MNDISCYVKNKAALALLRRGFLFVHAAPGQHHSPPMSNDAAKTGLETSG